MNICISLFKFENSSLYWCRNKEIISFASEEGIEKDSVEEKLAEYEFSGNLKRDEMLAIFDGESFKEKKRKANLLEDFIKSTVDKYSNTQ